MKIPRFELERWQSIWENHVRVNISESGVDPLTLEELVDDKEEMQKLLRQQLGYPQTNGSELLRERIAALYPGANADNVLVTAGCIEANFLATWALVEPGDEVIFMQPNYNQIAGVAQSLGAVVKPLWLHEERNWAPDLDELRTLVTPKTKLIAVCSPNNPTGAVLSEKILDEVCAVAEQAGAYVLADEVYRGAELEGPMSPTAWGRSEKLFCHGGLAKAYGLPGLRVGWVVTSPKWAERLWACHDYVTISSTMLSDRLATLALEPARHDRLRQRTREILRRNYAILREWIDRHEEFTHIPPVAGAIAWIGHKDKSWDAGVFAEELRKHKSLLVVPGGQLGEGLQSYLRLGYGGPPEHLREALALMDEVLAEQTVA